MSHQLNFYFTPTDIDRLELMLRESEDVVFLHSRSPTRVAREVTHLRVIEDGKPWLFLHLAKRSLLDDVVMSFVPEQDYWSVESSCSPVVDFSNSFFDGRILRRGRIFYETTFLDAKENWREKSSEFQSWAHAVLRMTRSMARKKRGVAWIGDDALTRELAGDLQLE